MNIFLSSLLFFFLAFLIHLLIWRVRLPYKQSRSLLLSFYLTFVIASLFLPFIPHGRVWSLLLPHDLLELAHVLVIFTSLTLAYLITYSALEADSPSLVMVNLIAQAMPEGLSTLDLEKQLNDDLLIVPRIKDLLRDNLATLQGDKLVLTPQGRAFVQIFIFFRSWLKIGKGG